MPVLTSGKYTYKISPDDLKIEQQAFEPGEGVSMHAYAHVSVPICTMYNYALGFR